MAQRRTHSPAPRLLILSISGFLSGVAGCGSDVVESSTDSAGTGGEVEGPKGEVDVVALGGGLEVTLSGDVGTVVVPFAVAVPEGPSATQLSGALESAASLSLRSDATGVTANLADGELIDGAPSSPGEFSWTLDTERTALELRFFNETPAGTTLKVGNAYTANFSIAANDYVENVPSAAVAITVSGG